MSRFYANINGDQRKGKTCGGHNTLAGHIRGWNLGIRVIERKNEEGFDEFIVYKTAGRCGGSGNALDEEVLTVIDNK